MISTLQQPLTLCRKLKTSSEFSAPRSSLYRCPTSLKSSLLHCFIRKLYSKCCCWALARAAKIYSRSLSIDSNEKCYFSLHSHACLLSVLIPSVSFSSRKMATRWKAHCSLNSNGCKVSKARAPFPTRTRVYRSCTSLDKYLMIFWRQSVLASTLSKLLTSVSNPMGMYVVGVLQCFKERSQLCKKKW